jgi:uncharacterized protein YyaL (SSP411 family)
MENKLIHSTSPYLLQHAHNPVDWHEWGPEAISKAVKEDKPILVSIGYSACHWCHVMERESFENLSIARLMNDNLVCIKVDREERPDVDQVYMEAVQLLGVHGGWPLNVFLTPDQKPFYGGTYFQPHQWQQVVVRIGEAFKVKRREIEESSNEITGYLNKSDLDRFAARDLPPGLGEDIPAKMFDALVKRFDRHYGGIEKAPKFVMPTIWQLLLRHHKQSGKQESLNMVALTLKKMTEGGLYDAVGGGFSRYSVDAEWFAPHFEKMLYDNAQLLSVYAELYSCTKDPFCEQVLQSTLRWLEREMRDKSGGFYSALDADSEGVEGKFYTWTFDEFREALGEEAEPAAAWFGVTQQGNWEHGRNILLETKEGTRSADWKRILLNARSTRVRPGLDDKILAGWNCMTIVGLLDAYNALKEPKCLALALECIRFIETDMMDGTTLYRSYKVHRGTTVAFLEDYAWLQRAYLSLYHATFNESWIKKATALCEHIVAEFFDTSDGYFNFSSTSGERLIARKKEIFDNVIPSSNSTMARNLHHLGTILERSDWLDIAEKMVGRLAAIFPQEPTHLSNWGILALEMINGNSEVAIVGHKAMDRRKELTGEFLPFSILTGCDNKSELPLLKDKVPLGGETAIYVCFNKTCQAPVTSVEDALRAING